MGERVLIGDENQRRITLLKELFEQEFSDVEVVHSQTFENVLRLAGADDWKVILFSSKLPYSSGNTGAIFEIYFEKLSKANVDKSDLGKSSYVLACIHGEDGKPELPEPFQEPKFLYIPAMESSFSQERRKLISEFRQHLNWSPRLPTIILEEDDQLLHEQVRSLDVNRKPAEGKNLLAQLVRSFFVCDKVTVARLGQGKSGSKVFHIRPEPCPATYSEFVLKLIPKPDQWKIAYEIEGHKKASATLVLPLVKSHITRLYETCSPQSHHSVDFFNHVASTASKHWYAICYVFLGGANLGLSIGLETVLIAEPKTLSEKVSSKKPSGLQFDFASVTIRQDRQILLKGVLRWLCDQWYRNNSRDLKLLWETPDAQPEQYSALPPYRFTGKAKERIIAFLDSFDAQLGARFPLPGAAPDWSERVVLIRELLSKDNGPTGFSKLDRPAPVLLAPAHGDLNAANILLWLEQREHHFLIDFPFYQEAGHVVQDFARLEVEMKFLLLDRQADSPASALPAFDYTPTQMGLWLELEEHLLNDWEQPRPEEQDWREQGYKGNVICCLELVQLIRNTAEDVYRQAGAAANFPDEYGAALLYHTLRVLGYPAVSIFKRLFAVYSASAILAKLS